MSAANRALARLPEGIFEDLVTLDRDKVPDSPEKLRNAICAKLKSVPRKTRNSVAVYDNIKTVGALLRLSKRDLLRALDPILAYDECEELYLRICLHCAPKSSSALSLLRSTDDITGMDSSTALAHSNRMRYLPTGISALDKHLCGGVRVGTITELVGKAGVGKTQLAMQLCVMAARYGQGSVYIDTEKKLSIERLKEIAFQRASTFNALPPPSSNGNSHEGGFSYGGTQDANNTEHTGDRIQQDDSSPLHLQYRNPHQVLANTTIHCPSSTDELLAVMATIEEEIYLRNGNAEDSVADQLPVRLVVLDSIAAPARRDFGSGSAPQRAAIIFQCAQTLKRLADELHLAIVVINQVGAAGDAQGGGPGATRAALGTSWHHCLSTRILFEYQEGTIHNDAVDPNTSGHGVGEGSNQVRHATIVKSNLAGRSSTPFRVEAAGVSDFAI